MKINSFGFSALACVLTCNAWAGDQHESVETSATAPSTLVIDGSGVSSSISPHVIDGSGLANDNLKIIDGSGIATFSRPQVIDGSGVSSVINPRVIDGSGIANLAQPQIIDGSGISSANRLKVIDGSGLRVRVGRAIDLSSINRTNVQSAQKSENDGLPSLAEKASFMNSSPSDGILIDGGALLETPNAAQVENRQAPSLSTATGRPRARQ